MRNQIGHLLAAASRAAPFERGRWRLGSLAYRMVDSGAADYAKIITTRHGFDLALDLRQFIDRTIFCTGEWEPHETQVIARILKPGDSFADVGANIGYFALLAAKIVGTQGHVNAFEANPETYKLLQDNIARNGAANVTAHHLAIGEDAGHAVIHRHEAGNAGRDVAMVAQDGETGDQVRMERLDSVLGDASIKLIKLDIEGGEAKALRGAQAILEGEDAPQLLFELTPQFLVDNGDDAGELLEWLRGLGYLLTEIATHGDHGEGGEASQSYYHAVKRR